LDYNQPFFGGEIFLIRFLKGSDNKKFVTHHKKFEGDKYPLIDTSAKGTIFLRFLQIQVSIFLISAFKGEDDSGKFRKIFEKLHKIFSK
jgi:hypothetical protein